MPACIYIYGMAGSGKTAMALALANELQNKGYGVNYFKPKGLQTSPGKKEDDDIPVMKKILSLSFSSKVLSPVTLNSFYLSSASLESIEVSREETQKKLDYAYQTLSEDCDVLLIEGGINPYLGIGNKIDDFSLARHWNAVMLQIIKADDDFEFDQALGYLDTAISKELTAMGCIFNNVTKEQWDTTLHLYNNIVKEKTRVLGALPRRTELATPTAQEFYQALGGEILAGEEHLNRKIENVMVGTMNIETALSYLRRSANKAVITGGDRSDMALMAMETSTSAIILTGGLYPDVKVLARAEEKNIPVLLVHYDTFNTVENLSHVFHSIHSDNEEAINLLHQDVKKYLDLSPVHQYVQE